MGMKITNNRYIAFMIFLIKVKINENMAQNVEFHLAGTHRAEGREDG
jgi:hypothetical protein